VKIELVEVSSLRHIEGYSPRRVEWLTKKILREGIWKKPVAIENKHNLVLDGQHRMEVALALGLRKIPAVKYRYPDVEVWSLRPKKYTFDWAAVVNRAVNGEIYPYKTVKHRFPFTLPACEYPLDELKR
jgi:hypothetical protein